MCSGAKLLQFEKCAEKVVVKRLVRRNSRDPAVWAAHQLDNSAVIATSNGHVCSDLPHSCISWQYSYIIMLSVW